MVQLHIFSLKEMFLAIGNWDASIKFLNPHGEGEKKEENSPRAGET